MLIAIYRQFGVTRCRVSHLTWLKIACLACIIVYFAWSIYRQPGRPPPAVADRPPLASFVHRPQQPAAVSTHNSGKIPRIVHQTWKSRSDLPETFRPWMTSWLRHNKDWEYWLWTDADIRLLMTTVFPQYLSMFDSYPAQGYRVDAFRYFVLYEYGGLYADTDMECLRPIDAALNQTDCIISQEPLEHAEFLAPVGTPLVSNALMACRPGHPFFAHVIAGLSSHTGWMSWNSVLWATGPYMLTTAYRKYIGRLWQSAADEVTVAAPDVFQPTPDDSMVDYMRRICRTPDVTVRQKALCRRVVGYDFGRSGIHSPSAFTVHHWTHSWVGHRNDPYGLLNAKLERFDIAELIQSS